jgi:DNA-binding LacI/PurR family transcriptional regulator
VKKLSGLSGFLNLAVFLPDYSSPNAARFLSQLNGECLNRGISMQPIYTHRGERLLKAYDSLRFNPNEGGIVLLENSQRATSELATALGDKGYECVIIDTILSGEAHKFVGVSNDAIIEIGLKHLYELGHRNIALLISEPEEKESVQQRIKAFENWTGQFQEKVTARVVHTGMHLWDDAYSAAQSSMDEVMDARDRPTAVFAVSDVGALGAMKRLQQRGYRNPQDVSVMGTDGLELGNMVHPPLTTLSCPVEEMTQTVLKLLTEKNTQPFQVTFRPSLLKRESTTAPETIAAACMDSESSAPYTKPRLLESV